METVPGGLFQGARRLGRATKMGAWLTVQPSTVNGAELGAQECRDALFLKYGLDIPDLPNYCDGRNATFPICYTLESKWGSLVLACNNELYDGVADLSGKAFTPSHVCDNSLIFAGCSVKRPNKSTSRSKAITVTAATTALEATENKGDLLIRGLW